MSRTERTDAAARPTPDWPTSIALLVALAFTIGGLRGLFEGSLWWFTVSGLAALVVCAAAVARTFLRRAFWPALIAAVALLLGLTTIFASGSAIIAFIPTPNTFVAFAKLISDANESIVNESVPAAVDQGILFVLSLGGGLMAIVLDLIAITLRKPAFTGIPLLGLVLTPSIVNPRLNDAIFLALGAAGYLLVLYVAGRRVRRGGALAVGAVGIALALLVPLVLPPIDHAADTSSFDAGVSTGLNPIINVGDDLRRKHPAIVMTYTTDASEAQYFGMATLGDFSGSSWQPETVNSPLGRDVTNVGPTPGLGTNIATSSVTTSIAIANVDGVWLPVPYAPQQVTGLSGIWTWAPDSLAIHTDTGSTQNQKYTVVSEAPNPTSDQLIAAPKSTDPSILSLRQLPAGMPSIISRTATQVTSGAASDYEKALDLQRYFLGGSFTYSVNAPVKNGYDGTGADVIAKFLSVKSGYCVHFASAMAIMARSLGIPSRVVVGLTSGKRTPGKNGASDIYTVTTDDFHAWPELYFSGVGWVRFEPTPGRGSTPDFSATTPTGPTTAAPTSTPTVRPTSSPTRTPAPTLTPSSAAGNNGNTSTAGPIVISIQTRLVIFIVSVVVVILVLLPLLVRRIRRWVRMLRIRRTGSASLAWREVVDSTRDLGWQVSLGGTPREFVDSGSVLLDVEAREALRRLLAALERTAFSSTPDASTVEDVRLVRRGLWRAASVRARVRAVVWPSSLFVRTAHPKMQ